MREIAMKIPDGMRQVFFYEPRSCLEVMIFIDKRGVAHAPKLKTPSSAKTQESAQWRARVRKATRRAVENWNTRRKVEAHG
jgi:hypothetical protein